MCSSRGIMSTIVSQARIRSRQLSGNKVVPEPNIHQDEGWLSGYLQLYLSPWSKTGTLDLSNCLRTQTQTSKGRNSLTSVRSVAQLISTELIEYIQELLRSVPSTAQNQHATLCLASQHGWDRGSRIMNFRVTGKPSRAEFPTGSGRRAQASGLWADTCSLPGCKVKNRRGV